MDKPDFQTMSQTELRQYFLAHRDDDEAFYAYVDKLHVEDNWTEMPADADLDNDPKFLEWVRKGAEAWNNRAS